MLISRVPEEGAGEGRGVQREDDSHEYQTASELFELIAKNHTFNPNDDPLTNSDLVILYKNIDLGTRLMSNANELKSSSRSNQRVESVVHAGGDPDSDSDGDDGDSSHHLTPNDVFLINKERLDLLNSPPSLENTLCHKFGDLEIKMSNLGTDVLFKTATVKEQLDNLKLLSSSNDLNNTVLPSSLLDYICCKRLEDNYNFYMENIIRYVKHTIEQLKRISNGDYLTDKAREKWREIAEDNADSDANKKILAASTSIPLHVERKHTGRLTTWDDIVHSEMDIRSLSKILEKKICLEIPKIICGSYRLFSKQCADNLIISCEKRARKKMDKKDSRVDVVLKLKRSESGHVVSNINSIMILQAPQSLTHGPIIALPVLNSEENKPKETKIIELNNETGGMNAETQNEDVETIKEYENALSSNTDVETIKGYEKSLSSITKKPFAYNIHKRQERSDTSLPVKDIIDHRTGSIHIHHQEAFFVTTPDELSLSMQRLDIQSSLAEESIEEIQEYQISVKKSHTKVRVKSPYENKSHLIDEKKRKKLLEIRERREKRKMALSENCKIMKHRHGKGSLSPQASSSVTKLSITNKSFYNSIYGQTASIENKQKSKLRKGKKESDVDTEEHLRGEMDVSLHSPSDNSKKYINRNYYLDDAETEMMIYMQMKGEGLSPSTASAISADMAANRVASPSLLSPRLASPSLSPRLASPLTGSSDADETASPDVNVAENSSNKSIRHEDDVPEQIAAKKSEPNLVPANSPKQNAAEEKRVEEVSTLECRKSIEKLYGLLKKIRKVDPVETNPLSASPNSFQPDMIPFRECSTVPGSDSGTSLKHHPTSSETSGFSFNKPVNASTMYETTEPTHRSTGVETAVVPKVIISTKCQTVKPQTETQKLQKEHKKVAFTAPKVIPDNPLKAISQLLHEFENAQKNRHKSAEERPGKPKKGTPAARQSPNKGRSSRLDQHLRVAEPPKTQMATVPRDRRQPAPAEARPAAAHDKYDKVAKKKMAEIIDEAKEARGEAVRGPPKISRLNTLAQPKKSYVQAHSEEYQSKYGRTLMADRLQRLAGARARPRRCEREPAAAAPGRAAPSTDCTDKKRRSTSSSPASKRSPATTIKHSHTPDVPDNLKQKMVAVETYVKSHYGRGGAAPAPGSPRVANKSRVPLLPSDIELGSLTSTPSDEESAAIGIKLHNIVDTMIKKAPALSALSEDIEDKTTNQMFVEEELSKNEDRLQPFSSDLSDIFKDNIHTAVEEYQGRTDSIILQSSETKNDLRQFSSSTELLRLENALYRQVSLGNFQKRLRIKNLTITPKQSMQHVVVVQSGDVGSLMSKTSISQDFELKNCSLSSNMTELKKSFPVVANTKWRLSPIPMQIATVGYAFPKYNTAKTDSKITDVMTTLIGKSDNEKRSERSDDNKSNWSGSKTKDYTCQTFKGQLSSETPKYPHYCNRARATFFERKPDVFEKGVLTDSLCSKDLNELSQNNKEEDKEEKENNELNKDTDSKNILSTEFTDNKISNIENAKQEDIEYTTSLDMLVGVLNEIQKITQMQVLNLDDNTLQLETILNNAATLESDVKGSSELVTLTSLDRSKMLDSSPSSYSIYITKSEDRQLKEQRVVDMMPKEKPTYVNKAVYVTDIQNKQYINTFTDVPSIFFPITINTSTSVTNSLMGVLSESTQSILSCQDLYSDALNSQTRIIELTENGIVDQLETCVVTDKIDEAIIKMHEKPEMTPRVVEEIAMRKKSKQVKEIGWSTSKHESCDPLLKMKRDILVTVYSVLVLTVFAALTFPDVLYRA